jgi:hypothetical protein
MLTREEILALDDINIKEITVPNHIPKWGGQSLYIKQLSRGQQDNYLKRQFGDTRLRQNATADNQEISAVNIYGHDAWLCVKGICDETGKPFFQEKDIDKLNEKNGEAIGWIANQIVEFSGMREDAEVAKGKKTKEEALADELKN